jgi:hypothetical protein
MKGNCVHNVWAQDGKVFLANDDDSWYEQEFESLDEVNAFVGALLEAAAKAFHESISRHLGSTREFKE